MLPQSSKHMFDTAEAADYVGLGKSTLDKFRLTGRGPRFVKIGRRVLYDVRDLDGWLGEHYRRSTSEATSARTVAATGSA